MLFLKRVLQLLLQPTAVPQFIAQQHPTASRLIFACLLISLPIHAAAQPKPKLFADLPITLHSIKDSASGNTRLRLAGGIRVGSWLVNFGSWQLGLDGGISLFSPRASGSPEIFVTPYSTELMARVLLGYAVRGCRTAFIPYGFIANSGQFTVVHLHTLDKDQLAINGDIAAEGGIGLAVQINRWMTRIDAGSGYGFNGLLWRSTLSLGMQL
ncbi:MAG: hypothetical protein AAF310_02050 [Myxococcota bacterium]